MYPMMGGSGGMWLIFLLPLIASGIAVAILVAVLRPGPAQPPGAPHMQVPPPAPEDVLRMRLASGEIDTEEFERRMGALNPVVR